MGDACGIPNMANWYVFVVVGREGETTYTDIYVCDEHMPVGWDAKWSASEGALAPGYEEKIRSLIKWDGSESWTLLEVEVRRLR